MKPTTFKEQNVTFAKDQKEYLPLPAYKANGSVTSCWELSLKERLMILFTGTMYFTVMTFGEPLQPQRPTVTFKEAID